MNAAEARRMRALEVDKRRAEERADAYRFLLTGEALDDAPFASFIDRGRGEFAEACSLVYDIGETVPPLDEQMYVGTGIGLLYGLGGEAHAWQLAGWNVRAAA